MRGSKEDSTADKACGAVIQVSDFVCGIAACLLDVPSSEAARTLEGEEARKVVKAFAEDKDVNVMLLVARGTRNSAGGRLEIFAGIPGDWREGDENAAAATVMKHSASLSGSQPLAQQVQVLSLGAASIVDALHAYVHRSFKPLLESQFSSSSLGAASGVAAGATLKKVAELELALRGCQQQVKLADVVLDGHFPAEVAALTESLGKSGSREGRESATEAFLAQCRGSEQLKKVLCDALVACHRDLSDLTSRFERRIMSTADLTPASERYFWMRMEEVLRQVDEQAGLPMLECTMQVVKRLKIRQHIPKQLEEDVLASRSKLETAQKYNILLREFPGGQHLRSGQTPLPPCLSLLPHVPAPHAAGGWSGRAERCSLPNASFPTCVHMHTRTRAPRHVEAKSERACACAYAGTERQRAARPRRWWR